MRWNKWIGLSLVTLLSVGNLAVFGQPQQGTRSRREVDRRKSVIENPVKAIVKKTTTVATPNVANPKVEPGKVKWHSTMELACAASKKSGKPVLLFQMMGNLDQQFC